MGANDAPTVKCGRFTQSVASYRVHRERSAMKSNIVLFDIPALDLDRAIQFYSAVLARSVVKEDIGGMPIAMLPTTEGNPSGCLCVVKDFKPSADGIMIYFDVNGRLKDAVAAVRANGGAVQSDVHSIGEYGFRAEVLDSEGNCIALHSETEV
jgi:hypothetical protein